MRIPDVRMFSMDTNPEVRGSSLDLALGESDDDEQLQEMRTAVRRAVAALPRREQFVIIAEDFDGWTRKEIARALGVTTMSVYYIRKSAVKKLRESLRDGGWDE